MTASVFIDGAAGTTGLEIADRLAGRSEFTLIALDDARRKDPAARAEALNAADFVILCLPDDAARESVALIENDTTRVIDASTAHRVAPGWTYGFPEVEGRRNVAQAMRVSNPGCYSTGFIALGHKHVPEMQARCGLALPPIFTPAVIPAHRGMVVEIPLPRAAMQGAASPDELRQCLAAFYADSPVVHMGESPADGELLLRASNQGNDRLDLFVFASSDASQVRLIAMLDNLGKGASGAAVQSLNLMAGLEETAGLRL
ncbi:MAG: N-acetyl-gamma-glutamyl-phosphate reductase [Novosphingobium sp. 32-60-15]|uniref:N-acetyl-gamma-glutamyl-phosphate reductase n=1 Tax=Novosphingobium sp. 32-60-15 TaxID=1970410 RepID=UPI000BD1BAEB|nr:N-acetyl-gamma-glutamyl-phosphate reductase [Novosphingobium sp. 32-60-15]OYX59589.1 MAG: N-acetyl-gamma-glutamyl-phosphate reductase [Novosphingobium sp. 32-60-15]